MADVSVLIVGGGINGAGLFRELALQGVDVLLVDRADFSSGASAAATRIVHGGLRYLENAEFRLVREALHERNRLLRNAPQYVRPLPTTIPIFHWASGVVPAVRGVLGRPGAAGDRGALVVKTGLAAYDWFAGNDCPMPRHRFDSRSRALALRPALNPDIVCTATYYDARVTFAERFCLELLLDGERLCERARAMNYVGVDGGAGRGVVLRDGVTGETCEVRPRVVVNATGAWIDRTNRNLGRESRFIGGTKGSHIVLDHPALVEACRDEMLYFANRDGRICLFYPFCGKLLAGATDIRTDDPDTICEDEEVAYLLDSIGRVFPALAPDTSHVVFRYCGVRPLPASDASTPGRISRDHSFPVLAPGDGIEFPVYSLVGGKWTTYRAFAEQVADELLGVLGRQRLRSTADLPIGGDPGACAQDLSAGEIERIATSERIVHLDDLILRRTLMGLLGEVTRNRLLELAGIIAPRVGWSEEQANAEVERTVETLQRVHGVTERQLDG